MHSKKFGNLGEIKVAAILAENGYSVFKEIGDISRIDLIAEKDGNLIRIQVKAASKRKGVYCLSSKKSGPNYRFRYKESDCDAFAVYCLEDDAVAWIKSSEITGEVKHINLRSEPSKNRQSKGIRLLSDYTDINRIK